MNKHLYRIVFNRALGVLQVVSELVRRPGHGASQSEGACTAAVRPVSLGLWVAFGWIGFASVASAQIATDMQAPGNQRPTVMGSPNAAPLINITTPSAAGVSRNTYTDFNVTEAGAVLNNSRTNTQTQLAGAIAGNPWLATGTAKIILNEVTGANPSQLNGYLEVAGDRAQVIIANPAGIACDGCGFINSNRVTLTTGTPVLNGGMLDSYRVTGGAIQVNGKGMDASRADYTDIISRAVQVNGGIWSPQLQVTMGANQVSADAAAPTTMGSHAVTPIPGDGSTPTVALDVSALGGMYANKITLIGTEHGVGVRNAGTIGAQAGDLVVTIDGRLENTGSLQSQNQTQVSASGGIANAGTISATRELTITTPQDVDNRAGTLNGARIAVDASSLRNAGGTIAQTGLQGMVLEAGALSNRNGGSIGMPVAQAGGSGDDTSSPGGATPPPATDAGTSNGNGSLPSDGNSSDGAPIAPFADGMLHIVGILDNDGGRINAASGFDLTTANGLANDGGQLGLRQLTLTRGDLSNRGGMLAIYGPATIQGGNVINDGGQLSFADALAFNVQSLSNQGGNITLADPAAMAFTVAGTLDNTDGILASNASRLTFTSDSLINERGAITHAGADGLTLRTGGWQGAGGIVATAGAANITAGTVDHHGATLSATQLTLTADALDNRGGTIVASGDHATPQGGVDTLRVSGTLDNSDDGTLASNGDLSIQAHVFGNANGTVQHAGDGTLRIDAATLNGQGGTLASNGALTLTGNLTDLRNGTTYAQAITVDAGVLTTAGGTLQALGGDPLTLRVRDTLDNGNGTIIANGALALGAGSLLQQGGTLIAAGSGPSDLRVTGSWDNTAGTLATMGATTVHAGNLINQGGTIQTAGGSPLVVTADGLLDNSQQGVLASDGDLTLTAATLDNTQGTIQHAGQGTAAIKAGTLNGTRGTIASNGTLALTGGVINLRDGTTSAQQIAVDADSLTTAGGHLTALSSDPLRLTVHGAFDNTGGSVASNGALQLNAQSLTNTDGTLMAAGTAATNIAVAGAFDNTRGTLATAGATTVHAGRLDNTGGTVQAASDALLAVTAVGALVNDDGTLVSNGALALTAGSLSNHGGGIQAQQGIDAMIVGTLDNSGGVLLAGDDLTVHAQTLLNRDTLSADASAPATGLHGQRVTLDTNTFDNTRGHVQARDALSVTGTALSNVGGVLDGTGDVRVTGTTFDNTGGQLIQRAPKQVPLGGGEGGSLTVHIGQALTNAANGLVGAEGNAAIHAGTLDNSGGITFARHDLNVSSDGDLLNRDGGQLQTGGALTLTANGAFDNSGGHVDATGATTITAASVSNVGGQLLAGDSSTPDAFLQIMAAGVIDNRGGTLGNRGGDVTLNGASIDNSSNGMLVAQRDLRLNTTALNNAGGTAYATRSLTYQNTGGTLDNTGGQLGAGDTAWLDLSQITNDSGGHIQANTLWLTTPILNNDGGELDGTTVHATFVNVNGIGRLYGVQLLDAHITGDYTHVAGQRLESDGLLNLSVDGTLTNQGTLQTQGELDITAANLINRNGAVINASNSDGSAIAHIVAHGTLDNQAGASLEGDALLLSARDITNTGDIVGDAVSIDANSLTNGRDLGTADAVKDYGEGFIGASQVMNLHVGSLANLDGTLYSGGDLTIAADAAGNRSQWMLNRSGSIQAEGNVDIAAQQITNERRMLEVATVVLTPAEQARNSTTAVDPQYRYNDTNPAHQPPNIDPNQVLDASELAKAQAYCDSHNWAALRCIGYPQGRGSPNTFQSSTTTTVTSYEVVTAKSAASLMVSGGDMNLSGSVRNVTSTIAAVHNLTINGPGSGATGTEIVENIAWAPTAQLQTTTELQTQSQYLVTSPSRTWLDGDWWTYDIQTAASSVVLAPGQVPGWILLDAGPGLRATLTAGGTVFINGADVTNVYGGSASGVDGNAPRTAAGSSGAAATVGADGLAGPGSATLGNAHYAQAGAAAAVGGASGEAVNGTGHQGGAAAQVVGSANQPLLGYTPPDNAMVRQHPDANAPFLVTTAPRFAKGASTSSDYLLRALGNDPANTHKRLGDGYYEQNLVLDQILQLTGRRTLNGGDGLAQYQSLMDGAASEAARLGLALGAPLTTDQIASLSSDIVWLVDQVVDGQHVLVPVVYLSKATADRLQSDGALIAGDTVNIQSTGTVRNDGTISGTQGTWLSADTLINQGALKSGGQLAIATRNDTINTGTLNGGAVSVQTGRDLVSSGSITSAGDMALLASRDLTVGAAPVKAGGNLAMVAGRDLTATASTIRAGGDAQLVAGNNLTLDAMAHTSRTGGASNGQETTTHAVSTINAGGNLALVAGNDLTSQGAQLGAGNQLGLAAGHDMTLNAVTDSQATYSKSVSGHTVTTTRSDDDTVRGTTVSGANGVSLVANNDLIATAATISSSSGSVGLMAGHDLTLATVQENHSTVTDAKTTGGGMLSKSTTRTHDSLSDSYAIGTTVSGDSVAMAAGNNLTATAAQIVADHDIVMAAGNNLTLNTANDIHTEEHSVSKTRSGVMGAGVGVMVGQTKQSQNATLTQTTPEGTVVGSLGGSVTMSAGNSVHLTNATVLSDAGTAIVGKNVTIDAALGTTDTTQTYKQSSAGLHVGLTGGVVSAAQAAYGAVERGSEVKDDRLRALYAVQAGYAIKDASMGAEAMVEAGSAQGAAEASGVSMRIGVGASSASSKASTHDETAYGSTIHSNGNVTIAATDGDLNVIGSHLSGDNVALAAADQINLLSQTEQHTEQSSNKNSSGEVGFSVGAQTGWYVTASAGNGKASGNGTTHAITTVDAANTLTLISGGDTTIQGAQAKGNTVLADIGGNLRVMSEQDTDDYASKQQQVGGTFVYGSGGSANIGQSKVNSHYQSVNEVSGIGAGDGGFQIHVNGNIDLKGGAIASTADASKNLIDTGSLTFSNIENKASAKVSTTNLGGDSSMVSGSKYALAKGVAGNLMGSGSDSDQRSSTTQAGIAQGTIITRDGDTSLDGLNRNPSLANQALKPVDLQTLQDNVEFSQAAKSLAYQVGVHYTDEAYKTMFIKQVDVYEVVRDENGNLVPGRKLTEEEKMNLQPSADGKVHVADNGIFNDAEAAEKYAAQHSTADGKQYYAAFPKADNALSELLVAGYQKNLENDFWGLTKATEETKLEMIQYGQSGLQLDGHSRGSMTIGNAMESLANDGSQGILSGTTVSFFGPAYNAAKADSLLGYLQNRDAVGDSMQQQSMVLTLQNHAADTVGRFIGWNPSTGGAIPDSSSFLMEMWRAVTGQENTSHNCYGSPKAGGCGDLWSNSPDKKSTSYPVNQIPQGTVR